MLDDGVATRVHDLLAGMAADLIADHDEDGDPTEAMALPVLTEWVLLVNVADVESGDQQIAVIHAPAMLTSHVVGLLEMARHA